jgi:hypothetical protein
MASLLAFLGAIPRIWSAIEKLVKVWEEKKLNDYLNEVDGVLDGLEKAKTTEERIKSARDIIKLLRGSKP